MFKPRGFMSKATCEAFNGELSDAAQIIFSMEAVVNELQHDMEDLKITLSLLETIRTRAQSTKAE